MLVSLTKGELLKIIKEAIADTKEEKQKPQEELLSPAQAVKVFNPAISKVSLHRYAKAGLVPQHRIGGRVWYKRSEVITAALTIKKYGRDNLPAA